MEPNSDMSFSRRLLASSLLAAAALVDRVRWAACDELGG